MSMHIFVPLTESVIHEFDPWFNYRTTVQLVEHGFYEFINWFDELSWYPLGRVVGGTVYPGIMVTAGLIHYLLNLLNFPIHIREVCVFLAPFFSAFTAIAAYLLTSELKDSSAGLLAAVFIGIVPGYISRSVAGSYDNEGIAIFLLVFTFYLWIKALKIGSAFYGAMTALFYFYMVSAWGGYVFITNLIPLHVFALILMGRFSTRIYVSYSTFYVIGTLSSMQIPFVGFQPTFTSEHMAALGIFGLIQIMAFIDLLRSHLSDGNLKRLFVGIIVGFFLLAFGGLVALTVGGYVAPWTGRFYSLWDTGYATKFIPIIASVSEHQPTAWPSFFFDLQLLIVVFPAGIFFCFRELRDEHVFVIIYSVIASYFAGVMVRLMLTLTPIVCVASALAFSYLLDVYLKDDESAVSSSPPASKLLDTDAPSSSNALETEPQPASSSSSHASESSTPDRKRRKSVSTPGTKTTGLTSLLPIPSSIKFIVLIPMCIVLSIFAWHCTFVTSSSYSSPSVVLASTNPDGSMHIIDDFREAYYWLRQNTDEKAKILSWWDYGYQITGMSNRTVLVDNNTWNNTHIATVGKVMSCSEEVSYPVMRKLDVDYVLVIFGGLVGYSGDDINKFLWMIRIGQGVYPTDISERNFFTPQGEYAVDARASKAMKESLMYKLSYYRFSDLFGQGRNGRDYVRNADIPATPISLSTVDEVYSTENMIVRIYQVKKPDNLGRPLAVAAKFGKKRPRPVRGKRAASAAKKTT
ncbi:hypothetical protein BASA61_001437 [Batrachochytrium salamandrivorans]|nr:hypothetical protein BASA61_001437 [Batrachochytrium salamandrivorans]